MQKVKDIHSHAVNTTVITTPQVPLQLVRTYTLSSY